MTSEGGLIIDLEGENNDDARESDNSSSSSSLKTLDEDNFLQTGSNSSSKNDLSQDHEQNGMMNENLKYDEISQKKTVDSFFLLNGDGNGENINTEIEQVKTEVADLRKLQELDCELGKLSLNPKDDDEEESSRVILLLDVDCYEVQLLLQEFRPDLIGENVPIVVVNHDYVILSVNYAAKRLGIKRTSKVKGNAMQIANRICRDKGVHLEILQTGTRYGKSDSFLPIVQSDRILHLIQKYVECRCPSIILNRHSNDEFFLDVTSEVTRRLGQSMTRGRSPMWKKEIRDLTELRKGLTDWTYKQDPTLIMEGEDGRIFGSKFNGHKEFQNNIHLAHGAVIAFEIMDGIYNKFGFLSSTGVAENKLLAKLASDLNKPEGIAMLTRDGFKRLSNSLFTIEDLPGFGGVTGEKLMQNLKNNKRDSFLSHVLGMDREELVNLCENSGFLPGSGEKLMEDLLIKAEGIDNTPVSSKIYSESMSVSSSFKPQNLATKEKISDICEDMQERLTYSVGIRRLRAGAVVVKIQRRNPPRGNHEEPPVDPTQINMMETMETQVPTGLEIKQHVFSYIYYCNLPLKDIEKFTLTANQMNPIIGDGNQNSAEEDEEKETIQAPKQVLDFINSLQNLDDILKTRVTVMSGGRSKGGRTCLTFWIVNRLLEKLQENDASIPAVMFIDFDLGQSKFTPPGVISVTKIEKPLYGPNHHLNHSIPIWSKCMGQIDAEKCTTIFLRGMSELCSLLENHEVYRNLPRVLHTQGLFQGLGVYLNCRAINYFQPTVVIHLTKSFQKLELDPKELSPSSVEEYLSQNTEFKDLNSIVKPKEEALSYKYLVVDKEVRVGPEIGISSNLLAKINRRRQVFETYFKAKTTHFLPLTKIGIEISVNLLSDPMLNYRDYVHSVSGKLVALCSIPKDAIISWSGTDFPVWNECKYIEKSDDYSKDFYGYGLVLGYDLKNSRKTGPVLEIISPIAPEILTSRVNCISYANGVKFTKDLRNAIFDPSIRREKIFYSYLTNKKSLQ